MPLTAIVSDIHGNRHALEAVLEDARREGAERSWCLGDVVGYGSEPAACLELVREHCEHIIRGNHEQAVLEGPFGFNPMASAAVTWTARVLGDGDDGKGFLVTLGERIDTEEAVLVHGSPSQPLDEYLFREDTIDHLPKSVDYSPKLVHCFQLIDRPCFVGHTHIPGVIDQRMCWVEPSATAGSWDTGGEPCIVNVGSVGQPRDGDRRASYVLFDGQRVRFRRVEYDLMAAARSIFAVPELPDALGQRLIEGW